MNLYEFQKEIKCGLDSHADNCMEGTNTALVIADFKRPVWVQGYSPKVRKTIQ